MAPTTNARTDWNACSVATASGELIANLQVLRAYAAANVVLVHLFQVYQMSAPFGLYGVDLFFVLSGFMMTMIATRDPKYFLTRRIIRIVPLYWLCTFAVFLVALLRPDFLHSTKPDVWNLSKSLFFIPYRKEGGAIQPLLFLGWTLNYEMFFYLIFALVLRCRLRHASLWAAAIVCAFPVIGLISTPRSVALDFYCAPIVLEFVLGIVVFHFSRRWSIAQVRLIWAAFLVAVAIAILPLFEIRYGLWHRELLLGLPAGVIVYLAVTLEDAGYSVRNHFVLLAGNASYVLYLTHPYVMRFGEKLLHPSDWHSLGFRVGFAILLVAVAVGLSCLIHLYIELPLMRWLKCIVFWSAKPVSLSGSEPASPITNAYTP